MASIEKRNDTYRITVSLGRDIYGKKVVEKTTFRPTKINSKQSVIDREVRQYAMEFEKRVMDGKYLSGEKITFYDFVQNSWLPDWATDNLTVSVREGYEKVLNREFYSEIGNMKMSKIKAIHLQTIYTKLRERNLSPNTIRRYNSIISSIMSYAYRLDIIQENPCSRCEMPKNKSDNKLHYFDVRQAKLFLEALNKSYPFYYKPRERITSSGDKYDVIGYTVSHNIGTQFQLYFTLAVYGGFRRGELIALKWSDIDSKKHTISINKAMSKVRGGQIVKPPKTSSGKRTIELPTVCFKLLDTWKKEERIISLQLGNKWQGNRKDFDDNYIFITDDGKPMNLDTPFHKFKEIITLYNASCKNDADKLPDIRLHDLRHTSATLLLAKGVDIETVSHRLGHSKPSITLDVYGHPLPSEDAKASNILGELLSKEA